MMFSPYFLRLATALTCLVLSNVSHAQIGFSHNWLEFSPEDKTTSIVFTNEGQQTVELEFASRARDSRSADQQLLIYPPVTRLGPGQKQTIRVMVKASNGGPARTPAFFWLDYRYRNLVEQEGVSASSGEMAGRVSLRTAVSLPVSYIARDAEPRIDTRVVKNDDGSVRGVLIGNSGQAALRIYEMQRGTVSAPLTITVLPGESALVETGGLAPPFRFHAKGHPEIDVL